MDYFVRTMKERFLDGKDTKFMDYEDIDHNSMLDDCWIHEQTVDAQEKYFDAD